LQGADLIIIPTANVKEEPLEKFEWELRIPSMQNNVFVAMCNRVEKEDNMNFAGESIVVDPNGDIVVKVDDKEQINYANIVGFMPNTILNIVVIVIISFVASIQVSSFRKLVDSPYTTTMSTGNLRSASSAAFTAITEKDTKAAIRAIRYFTIIFSFIFGAFLGGFLTLNIGEKAIWCLAIVLICAVILLRIEEQKNN